MRSAKCQPPMEPPSPPQAAAGSPPPQPERGISRAGLAARPLRPTQLHRFLQPRAGHLRLRLGRILSGMLGGVPMLPGRLQQAGVGVAAEARTRQPGNIHDRRGEVPGETRPLQLSSARCRERAAPGLRQQHGRQAEPAPPAPHPPSGPRHQRAPLPRLCLRR